MRLSALVLIVGLGLTVAAGSNAAPIGPNLGATNPNIVNAVAGCKLGFHPAYYGCAPNRYVLRPYRYIRPYDDVVEEWDEYTYY